MGQPNPTAVTLTLSNILPPKTRTNDILLKIFQLFLSSLINVFIG